MANERAGHRPALLDGALGPGGPIIVFDNVWLAIDDKISLRDVSFTLQTGHTKIFLGASGAGKSTILRLILGLLKPDEGRIFVNGEETDRMPEDDLMAVRVVDGRTVDRPLRIRTLPAFQWIDVSRTGTLIYLSAYAPRTNVYRISPFHFYHKESNGLLLQISVPRCHIYQVRSMDIKGCHI